VTRGTLLAVIGGAVVVVVALAVLTPTVIVGNDDGDVRIVAVAPPQRAPLPTPQGPQGPLPVPEQRPFRDLWSCLQNQGLGPNRGAPPDLRSLRKSFKACRGTIPGRPFRP
jgi:hypothetical protein